MLLPESMSRVVIVGVKSRMDEALDVLYSLDAVHLIDHTADADEGFSIGAPRPYSAKASERLLKVRAIEKDLDVNPKKLEMEPVSVDEIGSKISSQYVEDIEAKVLDVVDGRNKIAQKIADNKTNCEALALLSRLPLKLEQYSGYNSLDVIVGKTYDDPSEELSKLEGIEFFADTKKKESTVVAVFAKKANKDAASAVLSSFNYSEIVVPEGTGEPAAMLSKLSEEEVSLEAEIKSYDEKIAAYSGENASLLAAVDEELSLEVTKGETPLRIAVSQYSFVVDGWIPTAQVDDVSARLKAAVGDSLYMEVQEVRSRKLHDEEAAEPRFKNTPSKAANGAYVQHFEYPTSLVSTPKYQEIDPSFLIGIFFPFFFGFMVGDVGYAIPFIILGAYGLKVAKSKDFQAIATVLFFGGIWAFLFGFFFFGEMLGMHFIGDVAMEGGEIAPDVTAVTWEYLLNVNLPDWFAGLMFGGHGVGKLSEVAFLLKLSVYIGIVHLIVAYAVAFANAVIQHDFKEAILEKAGWPLSLVGMTILCWALTEILFSSKPLEGVLLYMMILGIAILLVGVVLNFRTEKAQAVLELPGIVGNILSYTRLAAIGMSKAGMALAFNYMSIIMIGSALGGVAGIIAGFPIFLIGHLMIWVLAILSAGLHGLRLQYVESMNKFFVGGGQEYDPLTIKRKNTKIVETEV